MKKLSFILAAVYCLMLLAACSAEPDAGSLSQSEEDSSSSVESSSSSSTSQRASGSSSSRSSSSVSSSSQSAASGSSSSQGAPSSSQGQASSQSPSGDQAPVPQTPQPAPVPAPATPTPAPVPPTPDPTPAPAPQPSGPYAYPFDVGQIQNDMIAWGQAVGMTHEPGARVPDNSSWDNPITASESFQGDILQSKLREYVQFYTSASWQAYGNEAVTHFTIYVSGTTFYVLH